MIALLCTMFFLSGCAALVFETLWFHQAGLAVGNSVWASSLVLAGFMGGMGLGNGYIGLRGHRLRRPARVYALLELTIAATGVALVHLLPRLTPTLAAALGPLLEQPWLVHPLRFSLSLLLLIVPASAMGATLPLLVAALTRSRGGFGSALGLLYGWNTLGAVCGALLGELWLVEELGIRGSALVAAGMNASAAAAAAALARRLDAHGSGAASPAQPLPRRALGLLAAAFLAGAALLALEVIWFRLLLLFAFGTGLTFSVMLAVVLAGIGLGGLGGSAWLARRPDAYRHCGSVLLAAGVACLVCYLGIGAVIDPVLAEAARSATEGFGVLRLAVPLMLPVALFSGVAFPLLGQAIQRSAPAETRSAGVLALANTLGAMLGPLVAAFLMLPRLGVEASIHALPLLYGIAALCVAAAGELPERGFGRGVLLGASAALLAGLALFPDGRLEQRYLAGPMARWSKNGERELVAYREGPTGTIVYLKNEVFGRPLYYTMATDSYTMSGTSLAAKRYMELFVYLPLALRPEPRRALLICYGVGNTAKALTSTRSLERIDVVDTSRDVLELSDVVYPDPEEHPLRDPRVVVHVEDGRHFLQTTRQTFDLITGEPPPPHVAGVSNLFSREFFALAHARLETGGVLSYWLPVHGLDAQGRGAIIAAFCDVFADCTLWTGSRLDWILVGTRDGAGPATEAAFSQPWSDPATARRLETIGVENAAQLGSLFLADSEDLRRLTAGIEPLLDDRPKRIGRMRPAASLVAVHRPWLDPEASRERFERSAFVRRRWPARLRERTLAYFAMRGAVDAHFFGDWRTLSERLPMLDAVLATTQLRTLPLWIAGGSWDELEIAREARRRGADGVWIRHQLGAAALAERRFAAAAAHYAQVRRHQPDAVEYRSLEHYALCRAGRGGEAQALGAGSCPPPHEPTPASRAGPAARAS